MRGARAPDRPPAPRPAGAGTTGSFRIGPGRAWRLVAGPLLTLLVVLALELLSGTSLRISVPVAVCLIAVVYAAFAGGLAPGLVSAAITVAYAALFFSEPGAPFHYSDESLRRVLIAAVAVPAVAIMAGSLRRRVERLARLEAEAAAPGRYHDLVQSVDAIVWEMDAATGRFTFVSRRAETLLGYPAERWVSDPDFCDRIIHAEDRERVKAEMHRAVAEGRDAELQYRVVAADGRTVWLRNLIRAERDASGRPRLARGVVIDVSGLRRAEEALRVTHERLELVARSTDDALWDLDLATDRGWWSDGVFRLLGHDPATTVPSHDAWLERLHADDRERIMAAFKHALESGAAAHQGEYRYRRPDGSTGYALDRCSIVRDAAGRPVRAVGAMTDITERKRAEERLRASEQRYRLLFESNPHPMWVYDSESLRFLAVNDAAVDAYGYTRSEFLLMTLKDIRPAEDVPRLLERLKQVGPVAHSGPWRHRRKDGTVIEVEIRSHALTFDGRPARLVQAADITEQRAAETALRAERDHLTRILAATPAAVAGIAPDGRTLFVNPAAARIAGYRAEDLAGCHWWQTFYPGDEYRQAEALLRDLESGDARDREMTLTTRTGEKRTLLWNYVVRRDDAGRPAEIIAFGADISERKDLENQLRMSQKMEAVGRLAGGVAHEFNNMMTAVTGYSELLLSRLPEKDPHRRHVEEIRKAGQRAAALTGQLLAFSRRQVFQPRVLDLRTVLAGMEPLLRTTLGEDVTLTIAGAPDLWRVRTDPGQIEQVVMNLAVNARDAMPDGGRLTIDASNANLDEAYARRQVGVQPGAYVLLAVSDSGGGMDEKTRSHLFEPFFTTKKDAAGLGLSIVYGIVKQSGGHVTVDSQPGRGTTFKIHLPRAKEAVEREAAAARPARPARGTETILLVEDEEVVRMLAQEVLEMNGYSVLVARHGLEALQIVERHHGPIDLMLTDVVMPHMNGRDLADHAAPLRPAMRVIFMSGYPGNFVVHRGIIERDAPYLQKPFTVDALARKVREILDAAKAARG